MQEERTGREVYIPLPCETFDPHGLVKVAGERGKCREAEGDRSIVRCVRQAVTRKGVAFGNVVQSDGGGFLGDGGVLEVHPAGRG